MTFGSGKKYHENIKNKVMKKRTLLIASLIFLLASCNVNRTEEKLSQGPSPGPNIIFIMSDDHAYQAISAYDDKLIQTPNIDRIAREGMIFTDY